MRLIQIFGDSDSWGHMGGLSMGVFGWVLMTLLFLLIGWIVWLGARQGGHSESSSRRRPLDFLDERYASGEIDRDEYLQRRGDLER